MTDAMRAEFEAWFVGHHHRGPEHDTDADTDQWLAWQAAKRTQPGYAAGIAAAAKWHETQAVECAAKAKNVIGSHWDLKRYRHLEDARAIRSLALSPEPEAVVVADVAAEIELHLALKPWWMKAIIAAGVLSPEQVEAECADLATAAISATRGE